MVARRPRVPASPLRSSPCKGDVITARPRARVDSVPHPKKRIVLLSKKVARTPGIESGSYMRICLWDGTVEFRKVAAK